MANLLTRFDQYGASRINSPLWFVLAYGLRHIALILFPPTKIVFENYASLFSGKLFLVSDCILLLVLAIYAKRTPEASPSVRWLWRHGRMLLVIAYILDFSLTILFHHKQLLDPENFQFELVAGSLLIDIGILLFLLTSKTTGELFQSFPEPAQLPEAPAENSKPVSRTLASVTSTLKNVPDANLINQPITSGYQYADFPFQHNQVSEQILEIRRHLANNNLQLAEKGLRFLLAKDPNNADLWHELGLVAFSADKLSQAESIILKAIIFDSSNYLYWRNLGEIRRRLGNFEAAISNAEQAIKLMPNDVNAHYNLGLALWDAGKNDEALMAFEEAKRLHPDIASQQTTN